MKWSTLWFLFFSEKSTLLVRLGVGEVMADGIGVGVLLVNDRTCFMSHLRSLGDG